MTDALTALHFEQNLRAKKEMDEARATAARFMEEAEKWKRQSKIWEVATKTGFDIQTRLIDKEMDEAAFYKWQRDRLSRYISEMRGGTHEENIEALCSREMYEG